MGLTPTDAAAAFLVDGPQHVRDAAGAELPGHYHAWFTDPAGERFERYLTDTGRATILDRLDRGMTSFTAFELEEWTVAPHIDALLARYDAEAGEG